MGGLIDVSTVHAAALPLLPTMLTSTRSPTAGPARLSPWLIRLGSAGRDLAPLSSRLDLVGLVPSMTTAADGYNVWKPATNI